MNFSFVFAPQFGFVEYRTPPRLLICLAPSVVIKRLPPWVSDVASSSPLAFAPHSGFVERLSSFDMWAPFLIACEL